jgi:RNA polymerase sigma-70 factor, ECF subfamily
MTAASTDQEDREDMARLSAGQDVALGTLMDRHSERLFHYLVRQLNNESDAADLAQETFVRVYHHRARFDPAQRFSTWLYTIATNLVRDRFRWHKRHPQVSLDAERQEAGAMLDTLPDTTASPAEQMATEERAVEVRKAIESLPDDLRTPLILSEYEGLSHAEIGAVLNCSAKAVETRIYRARNHLRRSLLRSGLLKDWT